mmetsp:Transcript_617/g.1475  ORF Transcript_617/g.1475 Transcript_617/m.1475 type:complete len:105 (-) Transcript_617:1720-2034(-)
MPRFRQIREARSSHHIFGIKKISTCMTNELERTSISPFQESHRQHIRHSRHHHNRYHRPFYIRNSFHYSGYVRRYRKYLQYNPVRKIPDPQLGSRRRVAMEMEE